MSYGVNKWASQSTRARSAGKRKKSARRTGKKSSRSSAPRVKKKRARSAKKRAPAKRVARKRAAKKERLYTRYDPETGQKVRVTKDAFEYSEWPSRKPSKKKIQRAALKADPLGTSSQVLSDAAKRATERTIDRTGVRVARNISTAALGAGTTTALRAAAGVAGAVGAILAAGYYVSDQIAKNQRMKLGDRLNAISARFVQTQAELVKVFGRTWDDVPPDVRTRAVNEYKRAIATASSQAQGSALVGVRAVGSYK